MDRPSYQMEYHQYELEDFLVDPEFRDWVLNPNASNHLFWKKCLDANPSLKKKAMLAKEIILSLGFQAPKAVDSMDGGELLKAILSKKESRVSPTKTDWRSIVLKAAASVAVLFAMSLGLDKASSTKLVPQYSPNKLIVKENFRGEKSKITLPDGSTVFLNNNSKISYRSRFDSKREIHLEGEAFFEVAKDSLKPFVVSSNGLLTKALGTSFNIKAKTGEKVEVGLVTGKILVSTSQGNGETELIDDLGGKATFDVAKGDLDISSYPNMDFYQWTNRIIIFKAASFQEVREILENWYNVEISVRNVVRPIVYTGKFKGIPLERVLEQMAYTERFSFKIDPQDERKISITFLND